jgi:hypothetical protein
MINREHRSKSIQLAGWWCAFVVVFTFFAAFVDFSHGVNLPQLLAALPKYLLVSLALSLAILAPLGLILVVAGVASVVRRRKEPKSRLPEFRID